MKLLDLQIFIVEQLVKISQKQSTYIQSLYSTLLNKQIEKINRKSYDK